MGKRFSLVALGVLALMAPSAAVGGVGSFRVGVGSASAPKLHLPGPRASSLTIGTPLMTLADVARAEKNPYMQALKLRLAEGFYKAAHWGTATKLQKSPYVKVTSGHADTLPDVDRAAINEALSQIGINLGTHEAHANFFGNEFTTQKLLQEMPGMTDQLDQKIQLYIKGVVAKSNNDFLLGDPSVDPKAMPGLKYRIANPMTYKISPIINDLVSLDLTSAGMTTANASKLARAIEDMFGDLQANNGTNCTIFLNRHGIGGFPAAMREAKRNLLTTTPGEFGKMVTSYGEAKLHDIGNKADGKGDASMILAPVANLTDIYVVNWDNFKPWQTNDMMVQKTPARSNVFDFWEFFWGCGAIEQSSYCYGVIKNVKWR